MAKGLLFSYFVNNDAENTSASISQNIGKLRTAARKNGSLQYLHEYAITKCKAKGKDYPSFYNGGRFFLKGK